MGRLIEKTTQYAFLPGIAETKTPCLFPKLNGIPKENLLCHCSNPKRLSESALGNGTANQFPVPKRQKRRIEPVFDIETRVLRSAIALAEKLSFTKAARKLRISQPALSKQIAELEERFDFKLFTRTNKRSVELTDAAAFLSRKLGLS